MFNRKQYKDFAKKQLKNRWTVPVLTTLIITLISLIFDIPDTIRMFSSDTFWKLINYEGSDINEIYNLYSMATASGTSTITSIIQIIVAAILEVAAINVYIKMSRSPEPVSLKTFIEGMNNWARALLASLWQALWIFIWTLVFIIPGIIKAYAYSQMFFIVAEYKNVSVTKAMRISMIITHGHKWDLFVMELSFIGWALLATLTLGIGYFWLIPYMQMTRINAFHAMLKEALESGKILPEDLTE